MFEKCHKRTSCGFSLDQKACNLIRFAIFVGKLPFAILTHDSLDIISGIAHFVALRTVTDLKNNAVPIRLVLQVMRRAACRKTRYHTGAEKRLDVFSEEGRLPFEDINELVLA